MKKLFFIFMVGFVLLNLTAVIGVLGYGLATGRFSAEKRQQYAATWRGEKLVPFVEEQQAKVEQEEPRDSQAKIEQSQAQRAIMDRELQRQVELLRSMQVTVAEAKAKLDSELKVLQAKKLEFEAALAAQNKAATDEGFQKALKNYSAMKPKQVKDDLMVMSDTDAVRYLAAMKATVATDILGQFRTLPEQEKRLRLMQLLNEHNKIELAQTASR